MPAGVGAYVLCSTPRTGSTWLCDLLESTGVAGRPASYFRKADESRFAERWGVPRGSDGRYAYSDFVRAALSAGTSDNGVFGVRIMWGTLDEVLSRLAMISPALRCRDLELLTSAFGDLRFVHLRRLDTVSQAVSLFRAEQTDVWHNTDRTDRPDRPEHGQEPRYEFGGIDGLVRMIEQHTRAWEQWFASVGVRPHPVLYEDLESDPAGVTRAILAFLGLDLPPGRKIVGRHVRLRDQLSAEWVERYRAEADPAADRPP
jgi:LPS sulfotransferase NodH